MIRIQEKHQHTGKTKTKYQKKYYKIGIPFFFAKNTALMSESKNGLVQNQDNVSDWSVQRYITGSCHDIAETIFLWC